MVWHLSSLAVSSAPRCDALCYDGMGTWGRSPWMIRRNRYLLGLALLLQVSGFASAATPPAKVVEQFIEAHLQGRFAESRSFTLERVNLSASPFSNWLFGPGASDAPTA